MIAALKNLFANVSGGQRRQGIAEEGRRLAAAALLVHVASIDGDKSANENARVLALLQDRFAISGEEARQLAEAADERDREAVDLYAFTSVLKQKLDEGGRLEIIDMMWDVAFADGVVHEFEENVIWRVAELLGVSARERIAAPRCARPPGATDVTARAVTLITGASRGIGAELARVFAAHGHDVALVARSEDKLNALADELSDAAPARLRPVVIALDLAAADAADRLAAELEQAGAHVEILVNNAGFGLAGEALELDRAEQGAMVDLNIRALVDLTLTFAPQISAVQGGILNVASTAAFQPGPGMAVYYASKAFVLSFSEAMAQELSERGVSVSALCPGPTKTGFQARAGIDSSMLLTRLSSMSARDVAEAGYAGLMSGRRVVVPGLLNKFTALTAPFTPHALLLPLVARLQKKRSGSKPA